MPLNKLLFIKPVVFHCEIMHLPVLLKFGQNLNGIYGIIQVNNPFPYRANKREINISLFAGG